MNVHIRRTIGSVFLLLGIAPVQAQSVTWPGSQPGCPTCSTASPPTSSGAMAPQFMGSENRLAFSLPSGSAAGVSPAQSQSFSPAPAFAEPPSYAPPQPYLPGDPCVPCEPFVEPCAPAYVDPCVCVCCYPFWQHRHRIFADYLFLSATDVDVNYAIPVTGLGDIGTPAGPAAFVDPGYESGFRVGGAWALDGCSSVTAAFWNYQSDEDDRTSLSPAAMGTTLFLNPVLLDPATINVAAESSSAQASYDIDFRLVDLAYERLLLSGPSHAVNLILGLRYGQLEQELRTTYSILGGTTLDSDIDFDGLGPRLGLGGEWLIRDGFFAYAQGTGNFLIGEFEADYLQQNTFAGVQSNISFEDDRIVPLLDLEMGLGWQTRCGRVRVKAGYYLASWFNAMTMPEVIGAVQARQLHDVSDTLTFSGLAAQLALSF